MLGKILKVVVWAIAGAAFLVAVAGIVACAWLVWVFVMSLLGLQ